jgi:hypothetical protein
MYPKSRNPLLALRESRNVAHLRAVTAHGVIGLRVQHNVAYNVFGHTYFVEDGAEVRTA